MDPAANRLIQQLRERRTRVAIMGLGYVGLPLSLEFVSAGFRVIGFDVNAEHVSRTAAGRSSISDVGDDALAAALATGWSGAHGR